MKVQVTLENPEEVKKFLSLLEGKKTRGRPPKKKKPEPDPEPEETEEDPEEETEEDPEPEPKKKKSKAKSKKSKSKKKKKSDGVTLRQLRKAANDYAKENGPDDIEELLEEYDIDSLNDLDESDYEECLAKIAELSD